MILVAPKGDNAPMDTPGGSAWVNLKLDDQSNLIPCDPAFDVSSRCNYLQAAPPTPAPCTRRSTPTFRGLNPKGTWRLLLEDAGSSAEPPTTIGVSTLEVKTARKFAKD